MPRFLTAAAAAAQVVPNDNTYQFQNRQVFTTSGTFNVPAGVSRVWVSLWGGGGGGGSNSSSDTGGRGGDGYYRALVSVTPLGTVTVTVGTGGAAGSSGGATSFGSLSANGGTAGFSGASNTNQNQPGSLPIAWGLLGGGELGTSPYQTTGGRGGRGAFGSAFGRGGNAGSSGEAGAVVVEW